MTADAQPRVLVVGFGLSGIVATHTFVANGMSNIVVVEAEDKLGGVWNTDKHYPSLVANNSKNTFEFPELRHEPGSFDDFPTQEQLCAYLEKYVETFDLARHVRWGTRVTSLSRREVTTGAKPRWLFDATFSRPIDDESRQSVSEIFDVVVLAAGFCCEPSIPRALASAHNGVSVMHASEIRKHVSDDDRLLEDKRVAIVGTGKSGQDLAVWAAKDAGASDVVLIGSTLHWNPPRYLGDNSKEKGQFNEEVLYSRFSEWMLPAEPEATRLSDGSAPKMLTFFHKTWLGQKMRDVFWSKIEGDLTKQLGIPNHLRPKAKISDEGPYLAIQNPHFYPLEREGKIRVNLGWAKGYDSKTGALIIQDDKGSETLCQAETVICATGYDTGLSFLSEEIKQHLFNNHGQMQLYRSAYCPSLPQMGFVGMGYNTSPMLSAALTARWVAEMAKGEDGVLYRQGVLDDRGRMEESIGAGLAFERRMKAKSGSQPTKVSGIYTIASGIHPLADGILSDFGSDNLYRGYDSLFDSITRPILPAHYKGLITEKFDEENKGQIP